MTPCRSPDRCVSACAGHAPSPAPCGCRARLRRPRRYPCVTSSLRSPFPKVTASTPRPRGEPFQALREAPGHGSHQGRGGHGVAADLPEEPGGARAGPQRRDAGVEIEPVEAFRLQRHVIPECLSGGTCHGHVLDSSRWVPHTAPVAPTKPHGFTRRVIPRSGPAAGVLQHADGSSRRSEAKPR